MLLKNYKKMSTTIYSNQNYWHAACHFNSLTKRSFIVVCMLEIFLALYQFW